MSHGSYAAWPAACQDGCLYVEVTWHLGCWWRCNCSWRAQAGYKIRNNVVEGCCRRQGSQPQRRGEVQAQTLRFHEIWRRASAGWSNHQRSTKVQPKVPPISRQIAPAAPVESYYGPTGFRKRPSIRCGQCQLVVASPGRGTAAACLHVNDCNVYSLEPGSSARSYLHHHDSSIQKKVQCGVRGCSASGHPHQWDMVHRMGCGSQKPHLSTQTPRALDGQCSLLKYVCPRQQYTAEFLSLC